MIPTLALLAWFFQASGPVPPATAAPAAAPTTSALEVSGVVVDRITGQPIGKARVFLGGSGLDPVVTSPTAVFASRESRRENTAWQRSGSATFPKHMSSAPWVPAIPPEWLPPKGSRPPIFASR
jgi:hypothetical protein